MRRACLALSRLAWRVARRDCRVRWCFWRADSSGSRRIGLLLVGVMVLVTVVVFRLRVWEVGPGVVVGVVVLEGKGVDVGAGVFVSSFSLIILRGDAVADDFSFVFSLFACTGRRRGDLNGLVRVDVAFSRRRRFANVLTEVIAT